MDLRTCSGCNKLIAEESVTALGKPYHPGCFKCHACHSPFSGKSFIEHEGKAYHDDNACRPHGHRVVAPAGSCAKCHQSFANSVQGGDKVVKAEGKEYHAACFVCHACHKAFSEGKFFKSKQGHILCQGCKHAEQ
jgi:hypothetical protein